MFLQQQNTAFKDYNTTKKFGAINILYNTIQYNTIQYNTIQYNTIPPII